MLRTGLLYDLQLIAIVLLDWVPELGLYVDHNTFETQDGGDVDVRPPITVTRSV